VISADDFHTYYQMHECARRLWLDSTRPDLKASPSEFDQLVMRKGRAHEEAHLAAFPEHLRPTYPMGDVAAGAQATAILIAQRTPVIYQGVLLSPDRALAGIPDFLIREGNGYVIRDAKLAVNLERHPEIPAQLGLYSRLLRQVCGSPPVRCEVLLGNGELVLMGPEDVANLISRVSAIKGAADMPDEAVGWSKCNPCAFFDYCWSSAVEAHDPAVVAGIERGLREALMRAGIKRYDDLLSIGVDRLAEMRFQQKTRERRVGEKIAERALRQVRVLMSGKLQMVSVPQLPTPGPIVCFDVESNPFEADLEPVVYLWGILVDQADGSHPTYSGVLASPGSEGDKVAWEEFLSKVAVILGELADVPFVHYAAYEKTWLANYVERWGDRDGMAERVAERLIDLYPVITSSLCLPVHSYSLKQVEKCAGFRREQEEYGSLWSVARYNALVGAADEAERKAIETELLVYNEEDCRAMRHVLEWARNPR